VHTFFCAVGFIPFPNRFRAGNLFLWFGYPPNIERLALKTSKVYMGISIIEGSLEVKLPTIWTDEKQSRAEAERRGRLEERRSEEKE